MITAKQSIARLLKHDRRIRLSISATLRSVFGVIAMAALSPVYAAVDPGLAIYQEHCSQCHEGNVPRAPHNIVFNMSQPEDILLALNEGVMKQQAAELTAQQRLQVANYLAGADDTSNIDRSMPMCASPPELAEANSLSVSSWGIDERNHRFVNASTAGLDKDNVSNWN